MAYDPSVPEPVAHLEVVADPYGACDGAHALVLMTEWHEFERLDLEKVAHLLVGNAVVDARNMLDPLDVRAAGCRTRGSGASALRLPHGVHRHERKVRLMRFPRLYAGARRAVALSRHYILRRPHDPEFEVFRRFSSLRGTFLDVGANEGKAALSFRLMNADRPRSLHRAQPVPREGPARASSAVAGLRLPHRRVPARGPGRMTLHVPIYRGVPLTGLASLVPVEEIDLSWWLERHGLQDQAGAISFSAVEVEVLPLDALGLAPSFLKIDVEGFELEVLEGLRSTDRCPPPHRVHRALGALRGDR